MLLPIQSTKRRRRIPILPILVLFLLGNCSGESEMPVDLEQARAEILKLHQEQRRQHFEKDSIAFAKQLSEHFISVNRGVVSRPTYEENLGRYHQYFSSVDFVKWDDVAEPIIRFSEDGKMAYAIVEKEVVVSYDYDGTEREGRTEFAWVTIYRKYENGWKIDCVASTNKPDQVSD